MIAPFMWPLKSIIYFVLFWVACVMALVNPIWGVVNYLSAYLTNPTNTWWGAPLAGSGMRFSMLAALFTLLGLLFGRRHVPTARPAFTSWEAGALALVAIAGLNLAIGYEYNAGSAYAFEKFWKSMLFTLIIGRLVITRVNLRLVLWTLVAGSAYIGYDAYTASPSDFWLGRLERIGGPDFSTTSGTATHLAAMLPLIGTMFLVSRGWSARIVAAVAGALAVNGVILCRTRSAFVGLCCGAMVALLAAPRVMRFRLHALLVVGAVLAFSLTDSHYWDRMGTLASPSVIETDAAAAVRTSIWKLSLRVMADHPQGIGPGNFPTVIGQYDERFYKRSSHNTLVVCFTELGIHGGIIFLCMAALSLRYLCTSTRLAEQTHQPTETRVLAYGVLVAVVTYFVSGLGTERFYCESFWWILVLPLCIYRMVLDEVHASEPMLAPAVAENSDDEHAISGKVRLEW